LKRDWIEERTHTALPLGLLRIGCTSHWGASYTGRSSSDLICPLRGASDHASLETPLQYRTLPEFSRLFFETAKEERQAKVAAVPATTCLLHLDANQKKKNTIHINDNKTAFLSLYPPNKAENNNKKVVSREAKSASGPVHR
jgi:hypothetical protein